MPRLSVRHETWPLAGRFTISRGSRTSAEAVVVELSAAENGGRVATGRGECVPYGHYGETVEGVIAAIEGLRARIEDDLGLPAVDPFKDGVAPIVARLS